MRLTNLTQLCVRVIDSYHQESSALPAAAEGLVWEGKGGLQNLHLNCAETDGQPSVLLNLLSCLNIRLSHTDRKR